MTESCTRLSDRMPAVAAGNARWTTADSAHLAACADCAAEWELVQRAAALGAGEARGLEMGQLSTDVLARVRIDRRVQGLRRRAAAVLSVAAAAAIALSVWVAGKPDPAPPPRESAFVVPLVELEALEAEDLELVLDGLASPLSEGTSLDTPTLGDLDSTELERVLRAWEG